LFRCDTSNLLDIEALRGYLGKSSLFKPFFLQTPKTGWRILYGVHRVAGLNFKKGDHSLKPEKRRIGF